MAIYLVGSTKGGVGKSTMAVNLAAALALLKRRVRLVDADIQGHATAWMQLRRRDAILQPILFGQAFGDIAGAVTGYADEGADVVIDAHGADCKELRSGLEVADLVLIPFQVSQLSLWALDPLSRVLATARALNPKLEALAFVNEAPGNWTERGDIEEARAAIRECREQMDLADTNIHRLKPFKKTIGSGRAVFEIGRSGHEASDQFWNLLHEAHRRLERRGHGQLFAATADTH